VKQFLLPPGAAAAGRVRLSGDDAHYLARVLRLREGDSVAAMDPDGTRCVLHLLAVGPSWCEAAVAAVGAGADSPLGAGGPGAVAEEAAEIVLLQCLPKGPKMDSIVRQATEAGVARIVPLLSEHTLVRPGDEGHRLARWERIAREALQQSGNPRMPVIEEPRPLAAVRGGGWGTGIFFHEVPAGGASLHEVLAGCASGRVSVLVGPEGGLSPAEVALLRAEGFSPAWLGATVLRVDTAAVAAVAVVKQVLRERNEWRLSGGR
jgi:16S rRNA (uracil1498-N3)-methyltransferase